MTLSQIHVRDGSRIQTLAAVESPDGVTVLSTNGSADGDGDTEMRIPDAACAWLAGVLGRRARARPALDDMRRCKNCGGGMYGHPWSDCDDPMAEEAANV